MKPVLGIIGGGQLALYLCDAARKLGVKVSVLADNADAPALQQADKPFVPSESLDDQINAFLANCDVITFDKEAIGDDTLSRLAAESQRKKIMVRPGLATLHLLKDKARQKMWLQEHGLPTLPFHILQGRPESLAALTDRLGYALVQKSRSGGYDGRGVQILDTVESLEQFWDVPSIAEPLLSNCQEISVVTARSHSGALQTYPPVGMEFDSKLNVVRTVFMPAAISPALGAAATALAERVVTLLQGIGVFAIEMFVTPAGGLLINEISPRVHNSGHLTQEACNVSQFEQHVRAVMGMPLQPIAQLFPAAMCNLLYSQAMKSHCPSKPITGKLANIEGAAVYWYGKAIGRNGRKMGHINAVGPTVAHAIDAAQRGVAEVTGIVREQVA